MCKFRISIKVMRFCVLKILLCIVSLLVISCDRDECASYGILKNTDNQYFPGFFINLADFNLLSSKSSSGEYSRANFFNIDSLLLWEQETQCCFFEENILYRQIPLKESYGNIYCTITTDRERLFSRDSMSKVKSYYVIVELVNGGEIYKYVATMFPEYSSMEHDDC